MITQPLSPQLLQQYQQINDYFRTTYPELIGDLDIFGHLSKISEELGELNGAVLSEMKLQREAKLAAHSTDEIKREWADVFNTVVLFALVMGIDPQEAITSRMHEIFKRYQLEENHTSS